MVADAQALRRWADRLAAASQVALDTEANSMHAYREETCIMQLTVDGRTAIVDVLALGGLGPLRGALDRLDVEVILHGGDYDITVLTRDHDFGFERVFDTMIAATLLGDERVGLAALVEDHFGVKLDKRFQRADWGRRPLSAEQIDYLRRDTMYLPALRAHYGERLREADLVEEAEIEFRRLATRRGTHAEFDEEGWRRIKGARALDDRGRAVLRRLYLWREAEARERNKPPFKVLAPAALVAVAERTKREPRSPRDLHGLHGRQRGRYGKVLLGVVTEGLRDAAAGEIPPKDIRPRLSRREAAAAKLRRRREDALRDWRRREARRRDVPNMVVLPNPGLAWLVETMPETVADLGTCADIGPKRISLYGEKLIEVLDTQREP
jgi:ribonuclease D